MKFIVKKYICGILAFFCICGLTFASVYSYKFYTDINEFEKDMDAYLESQGYTLEGAGIRENDSTQSEAPVSQNTVKSCSHEYVDTVTKEATCAEEGIMTFKCSKCGDTYTQAISATGNHTYENTITKEATCTEIGEMTYICSVCGDTYVEEIPATGHEYSSTVPKKATCLVPGEQLYACSSCGDTYTEEIPALGHIPGEPIVTKEAGLFTTGEKVTICVTCAQKCPVIS